MREPQRLFARLNAITVNWEDYIRVTGPVLGSDAIAAGLAGLERVPYLLLRYLWCMDETVVEELYCLLLKEIVELAYKRKWGCRKDCMKLFRLVKMALCELQTVNLCKTCKGTGVIKLEPCSRCYGSGIKRRTQEAYAKYCGVSASNWERSWQRKYQEVLWRIVRWNEKGIKHLLSRL
ncbi:MAG: hypothetical protein JSS07_04550 [Proteobacteria bacterium]|nr:hypothetical protein [Pseudomonadota bacterium]